MMENGMQESRNGRAPLADVNEATFTRLLDFAYTGNYNPADPIWPELKDDEPAEDMADKQLENAFPDRDLLVAPAASGPKLDLFQTNIDWTMPLVVKKVKKHTKTHRKAEVDEDLRKPPGPTFPSLKFNTAIKAPLDTASMFPSTTESTVDYLPIFLSHADLYIFSDKYLSHALRGLTADRLHKALTTFEYHARGATDIAQLVAYAYEHTAARDEEIDVLRAVVTNFCSWNAVGLARNESFLALLQQGGPLVRDVFVKSHGISDKA